MDGIAAILPVIPNRAAVTAKKKQNLCLGGIYSTSRCDFYAAFAQQNHRSLGKTRP